MKNSLALLFLFSSVLLLIPTASATTSPATSVALTSGTISLIGTVDVSNLPATSQPTTSVNRAPLHSQGVQAYDQAKAQAAQSGYVPAGEAGKTVAIAPTNPLPQTTTVGLILEGAQGASPNPCGCTPPDGAVGAGPNHVFSMVNTAGIIYTKAGALVRSTFGLDGFFGVPGASLSDPQVSFDASSGRWFASIINIGTNQVLVAVSTSNDPTGTFNLYAISDPNHLPDQPVAGTNNDKYVVSVNDFNTAGTRFLGVHYFVLNKSELVAGAATIDMAQNTPDTSMFSLHPAQHLSSSTTFYLVTDCTGSCVPSPSSTTNTETVISLTGVPPGTVTASSSSFSISTSVIGPNAAQPGTSTTLNTDDNRVESVVWESNSLWAAWNDACVPIGDSATRTCLRLVQATTSGSSTTKNQDFDFAAAGAYYFYPAVTSFQGQLAVSFGTSSSSVFPSAVATGRASSDPINTLQAPATVRSGSAPDTSTRYGDYFGAATDPTPTAASTFWLESEYRQDSTFQNWNTVISQVGAFSSGGGTFDFSVSLNPTSGSVVQGSGTTSTVTVSLVSGATQSVSLSTSINPTATGLTASVNPTTGTPTYTSTLTISTTASTPAGSYTITVTGTSGSLSHSATYTLTVTAPGTGGDFGISASPSSLSMARTGSTPTTITITALNGFTGTVSLSTGALPTGVSASFNPGSVSGSGSSTLTFTGSGGQTPTGTFTITVTGTSGSLTHSTTITLTITKH